MEFVGFLFSALLSLALIFLIVAMIAGAWYQFRVFVKALKELDE